MLLIINGYLSLLSHIIFPTLCKVSTVSAKQQTETAALSITSQGKSLHIYTIGFQNVLIQLDH